MLAIVNSQWHEWHEELAAFYALSPVILPVYVAAALGWDEQAFSGGVRHSMADTSLSWVQFGAGAGLAIYGVLAYNLYLILLHYVRRLAADDWTVDWLPWPLRRLAPGDKRAAAASFENSVALMAGMAGGPEARLKADDRDESDGAAASTEEQGASR